MVICVLCERRRDMHVAVRNHATLALFLELFLALCRRCRLSRRSGIRRCSCGLWFFWHVSLHSFDAGSQNRLALLADRLLLRCHGARRGPLRVRAVGVRTLAAHRQIPAVANTAIGLNFNQAGECSSESPCGDRLPRGLPLDGLADVVDFLFGQVANFFRVVHAGFGGQLFRALRPMRRWRSSQSKAVSEPEDQCLLCVAMNMSPKSSASKLDLSWRCLCLGWCKSRAPRRAGESPCTYRKSF